MPLLTPDERLTVLHDPAYPLSLPLSDAVRMIPLAVSPFALLSSGPSRACCVAGRCTIDERRTTKDERPPTSDFHPSSVIYHSPYIAMPYLPGDPRSPDRL